jgi:hypothetical protein
MLSTIVAWGAEMCQGLEAFSDRYDGSAAVVIEIGASKLAEASTENIDCAKFATCNS